MKFPIGIVDARYLSSMGLIFVLSLKKKRSTPVNVLMAALVWWLAFGHRNTIILLIVVAIDILALWTRQLNEYHMTALNIGLLYIYKVFGTSIEPRIGSTFDISGNLMILTVKVGYIAQHFDGNIRNVLDYIFFVPGLVTGPTTPYKDFIERDRMAEVPFPRKELVRTLWFLVVHGTLRMIPFKSFILSGKYTFVQKLVFLYLFNLCGRIRFHFAWNFAHCCFCLYNLPEYLNIDLYRVELTESVREIALYWNQFISQWVRNLFFNPLRGKSILKAIVVSHCAPAALHGVNPCYLIFFLSFGVYRKPIAYANSFLKIKALRQAQMILFIAYFSMPFYLLNLRELFRIWKSVYFYGHIYFTALLIWYWTAYFLGVKAQARETKAKTKVD